MSRLRISVCQSTNNDGSNKAKKAVSLYCAGLSFRTIGVLLGYANTTILIWVREFAIAHYHKPKPKGEIVFELDEIWHFIQSKKQVVDLESILPNNWRTY